MAITITLDYYFFKAMCNKKDILISVDNNFEFLIINMENYF